MLSSDEKSLLISYDPRIPDFIYLRSPNGRSFEKCFLLDPLERYSQKNFLEIEYLLATEEMLEQKNRGHELQEEVDLMADIESVVSRAEKMAEVAVGEAISNRQKVAGIRENRAFEKAKRRENEGFELAPPAPESSTQAVSPNNADCAVSKPLA